MPGSRVRDVLCRFHSGETHDVARNVHCSRFFGCEKTLAINSLDLCDFYSRDVEIFISCRHPAHFSRVRAFPFSGPWAASERKTYGL
jgi:hypothetical protein